MCRILVVCSDAFELQAIRKSITAYDGDATVVVVDDAEMACSVPGCSYDAAVVDAGAFEDDEDAITLAKHLSKKKGGYAAVALLSDQQFVNRHGLETMLNAKQDGGVSEIPSFLALVDPANLSVLMEHVGSNPSIPSFRG